MVTNAEVVEDNTKPPKVIKPLDAGRVFDADVSDAPNAKTKGSRPDAPAEEQGDAPKRKRRAKQQEDDAPPEVTDMHLMKARNYITMADGLDRARLAARYRKILTPESLAELDGALKLNPAQVDLMAVPFAEGLARHGASLPWYAEMALGALGITLARASVCSDIEERYQAHVKATEGKKP